MQPSRPKRAAAVAAAAVLKNLMVHEEAATQEEAKRIRGNKNTAGQQSNKKQRLSCSHHDSCCAGQRKNLSCSVDSLMEFQITASCATSTSNLDASSVSNFTTVQCPNADSSHEDGHYGRDLSIPLFEQEPEQLAPHNIKKFIRPGATLRELIQKGLELCSKVLLDEQFWTLIHLRIKSHPMEVTSRDFQSVLMFFHFPHQIVPEFIIRAFFQTKRIARWWDTFRHVATCHWTTTKTIRLLIDAADDEREMITFCARLFSLLEENEYSIPPPLPIIREILLHPGFGLKVLQEMVFDDGKVAMHYACSHEENAGYVRLMATLAKDMDEPLATSCNCYYGGLLKYDCTDETPLNRIVFLWSDKEAAKIIAELFVLYDSIVEKLPTNILHHAILKEKWEVCKLLIQKAPRLLIVNNRIQGSPLYTLMLLSNTPNYTLMLSSNRPNIALAVLMVEQGLRVSNNDPVLRDTCGLLLMNKHSSAVSPLHFLYEVDRDQAKQLLDQVISYLIMELKFQECSVEDIHNCIVRLLKELVLMHWWEYLEDFVVNYPNLLSAKDSDDNLPLHHVCKSQDTPINLIRLVIESGMEVEVGGKKARGGLVIPNNRNEYPLQLLCNRSCKSNNQLLKHLIKMRPKLVLKRDYKKLNLLHYVANGGKVNVAKQLLKACPESISFVDENGRLPIHVACLHSCSVPQSQLLRLLLKEGIKQKIEGKGGLLLVDDTGKSALDYAIDKLPCDERRWSSMNVLAEGIAPDLPLIQAAIHDGAPQWKIFSLLLKFPHAATIKDEDGRLPLHVFLEKDGALPNYVYEKIISSNTAAVKELSGFTGLYPFLIAATLDTFNVNSLYRLLRLDPSILECSMG
jgi:ankyrin repeat protein